jgi:hypothetical protein
LIYFARLRKYGDVILVGTTMAPLHTLEKLEAAFGRIREATWLENDDPRWWDALAQRFDFFRRFRHLSVPEWSRDIVEPIHGGRVCLERIHQGGVYRADPELLEFLATLDPATATHSTAAYLAWWQADFERHRSSVEGAGVVYFAQLETGAIKIGVTKNLDSRARQLKGLYRGPVEVLGTIPGDIKVERLLHQRFRHLRLGWTEQFQPTRELMEFIGQLLGRKLRVPSGHPKDWDKDWKAERVMKKLERQRQAREKLRQAAADEVMVNLTLTAREAANVVDEIYNSILDLGVTQDEAAYVVKLASTEVKGGTVADLAARAVSMTRSILGQWCVAPEGSDPAA